MTPCAEKPVLNLTPSGGVIVHGDTPVATLTVEWDAAGKLVRESCVLKPRPVVPSCLGCHGQDPRDLAQFEREDAGQ